MRSLLALSLGLGLLAPLHADLAAGPWLQKLGHERVSICWLIDRTGVGEVRYGTTLGQLNQSQSSSATAAYHSVELQGLLPDTRYYYALFEGPQQLAGGDWGTWFRTAPAPGGREPVRLWAAGDVGTGTSEQAAVLTGMLSACNGRWPELFLGLGDLAYDYGNVDEFVDNFFTPYKAVLPRMGLFPCVGNHETYGMQRDWGAGPQFAYFNLFDLPTQSSGSENYYSFVRANLRVVVLDSQMSNASAGGPMATWLQAVLAASSAEWTIACFHHGPYTKGSHDSDSESQHIDMRENILPILESYGVDLVLSGHSHVYERSYLVDGGYDTPTSTGLGTVILDPGDGSWSGHGVYAKPAGIAPHAGAVYITTGNGGHVGSVQSDYPHVLSRHSELELGSCIIDVVGSQLTVRHIRETGQVSDLFSIRKGPDLEAPQPVAARQLSSDQILLQLSEPVAAGMFDPARYSSNGTSVLSAAPTGDPVEVLLGTSPHLLGPLYSLHIVDLEDIAGNLAAGPFDIEYRGDPPAMVVLGAGQSWQYFEGSSDPGAGWQTPGYNASNWPLGASGFGYGDGDDATLLSNMENHYTSVFLRQSFQIPDVGTLRELWLDLDYDDGFVAYLNGVEVARANAPDPALWSDTAITNHEAGSPEFFRLPVSAAQTGSNLLAIHGLNRWQNSSDFSLIPVLKRIGGNVYPVLSGPAPSPPLVVLPPAGGGGTGGSGNSGNSGNSGSLGNATASGSAPATPGTAGAPAPGSGGGSGGGSCSLDPSQAGSALPAGLMLAAGVWARRRKRRASPRRVARKRRLRAVLRLLLLAGALGCSSGAGGSAAPTAGASSTPGGGSGSSTAAPVPRLRVGAAAVEITPGFERFDDADGDGFKGSQESFFDTGRDGLYSSQEPGYHYQSNPDPHGDDYDPVANPDGSEANNEWDETVLAGFGGFVTGSFITGNTRYANGALDPLWARSLVLEKDSTLVVLQTLDLVGLLHVDTNYVKRRIEQRLGIPSANIVIASTHCHSGPDVVSLWSGKIEYEYLARLRERMLDSIQAAYAALRPAELRSATSEPLSAYDAHSLLFKTGPQTDFGFGLPNFAASLEQAKLADDIFTLQTDLRDPFLRNTEISALGFYEPGTQQAIATLINWHNHPEVLTESNIMVSSDFPHFVRQHAEATLGGTCLYFSGTVGGQIGALEDTPVPARDAQGQPIYAPGVLDAHGQPFPSFHSQGSVEKIRSLGRLIAEQALAALASAPVTKDPQLQIRSEELEIDFEYPAFQVLASLLDQRHDKDPQDQLLQRPYFVSLVGGTSVPISHLRIGEAEIITAPGEIFPDHWLGRPASSVLYNYGSWDFPAMPSVRAAMQGRDRFVFGLAHSYLGYMIPETDYLPLIFVGHPNYYEEFVSAGSHFGDNVGNKMLQMLGSPLRFSSYPIRP